jgi:ribosomal protein S2
MLTNSATIRKSSKKMATIGKMKKDAVIFHMH